MRLIERITAILIVTSWIWLGLMWVTTSFQGEEPDRILRVEIGSDATSLNRAVRGPDRDAVAHNIQMVVRNTYLDFFFILLYWLTFLSLSALAWRMGKHVLATFAALLVTAAAICDLFENGAILTAMRVRSFSDAVAVDISEFSQWKWSALFLAALLLGIAIAVNDRVSLMRRISGGLFIASGVVGLFGITRYRVSVDVAIWGIDVGLILLSAALLLSLWKIVLSLRELGHRSQVRHSHHHHAHV